MFQQGKYDPQQVKEEESRFRLQTRLEEVLSLIVAAILVLLLGLAFVAFFNALQGYWQVPPPPPSQPQELHDS